MATRTDLILVDEYDNQIGIEEKLKAHQEGKLHRAFSIFIFNTNKELLLQRRALSKYHCGGLWTNTCCSHPAPSESTTDAAHRRLREEMGFDTNLEEIFSFTYKAEFENGLTEHEFDHVFIGYYKGDIYPQPEEVEEFVWISQGNLEQMIKDHPKDFTPWFHICYGRVLQYINENSA